MYLCFVLVVVSVSDPSICVTMCIRQLLYKNPVLFSLFACVCGCDCGVSVVPSLVIPCLCALVTITGYVQVHMLSLGLDVCVVD